MSVDDEEIYDVFLSHSHNDAKWVEELAKQLEDREKLHVWLDKWILVPGEPWQQGMARGLNQAKSCVVCNSEQTPKGWFQEEIERAINRQAGNPSFRVIPMLLPGVKDFNGGDFLGLRTWVDFRKGIDDTEAFHRLVSGIKGVAPGRGPQGVATSESPYDQIRTDKTILSSLPEYPVRLREFVTDNRADELTQYINYLENHRILFISGVGGVGKTTLVRALVETRPANIPFPFWFDFGKRPDATLGDVLEQLAGYMNAPKIGQFREEGREAGQDDISRLTDELGTRESIWLIFDNLETALDDRNFHDPGVDSLFTSLRDNIHQAKIIITSRTLPVLADGESLIDVLEDEKQELKGLKTNFAVDYLIKNGLGQIEQSHLEELASGVDGHPLALKLLIGLVNKFGIKDTLDDINLYQKRKEDTIKKARRLFDKLAGDEKELLERISVFRNPESISAIKKMYTDKTSMDAVEKLIDKSLLETDHKGKYWLHPLVREFSYGDLKNNYRVHKIACSYYLSIPVPEIRMNKEDILPLIQAYYHACMAKEYDVAYDIIFFENLTKCLDLWGNYRTLVELYTELLPKNHFKDKPLIDIEIHSFILFNLGNTYIYLGEIKKAIEYIQAALSIYKEIYDRDGESGALGKLGNAYFFLDENEKAIQCYQEAIEISQEINDRQNEGVWVGELGKVYYHIGKVEKAIQHFQEALDISREVGDKLNEGCFLGNLGNIYQHREVEKAIEYYHNAIQISQENGDKHNEGIWMGNLGLAYSYLNEIEKAIEYYQKAIRISQIIDDKPGEGVLLGNLGLAYISSDKVEKGINYCQKALTISQETGDRSNESVVFSSLGNAYILLDDIEKAIDFYQKALRISQEINYRFQEGIIYLRLGKAFTYLENFEKATENFKKAMAIGREIKDPLIIDSCEEELKSLCL